MGCYEDNEAKENGIVSVDENVGKKMSDKKLICMFNASAEGCKNSEEKCSRRHAAPCNHIGCIQRGQTFTHASQDCVYLLAARKEKPSQETTAQLSERASNAVKLLEKIYFKVDAHLKTLTDVPPVATAGKITGMFQAGCEFTDLIDLVSSDDNLHTKIADAIKILTTAGRSESPKYRPKTPEYR